MRMDIRVNFFKLDMERLGIATKRKPAKVIDIAQYIENNRGTND